MNEYDSFQNQIRQREFCIGWCQVDSQEKIYYQALFVDWHEANRIACGSVQPGYIPFVEAATNTVACPRCNGTGTADVVGNWYACTHCHGRGKVRA